MNSDNLCQWLRQMEALASDLYAQAGALVGAATPFGQFLGRLSDDEALHYHMMGSAAVALHESPGTPPLALRVDDALIAAVEQPLRECLAKAKSGVMRREDIIDCIVRTEYSEWNDLFLYVVGTCKEHDVRFERMAAQMQAHQDRIAEFLKTIPTSEGSRRDEEGLQSVWEHRYLVVDDEAAMRELYRHLLKDEARIVTAANGNAALEQLSTGFFDAVVSDVEMPGMDGLTLFRTYRERHPDNANAYVFCTGNVTDELKALCKKYDLLYFEKPFSMSKLRDTLRAVRTKR